MSDRLYEDSFCECCGDLVDDCKCPACPVCGDLGNPDCYGDHIPMTPELEKQFAAAEAKIDEQLNPHEAELEAQQMIDAAESQFEAYYEPDFVVGVG